MGFVGGPCSSDRVDGLHENGPPDVGVAAVAIATLPQRLGASSVVIIGVAGVVGVLVALLAMGAGFEATLKRTAPTIQSSSWLLKLNPRSDPCSTGRRWLRSCRPRRCARILLVNRSRPRNRS